MWQTIESKAAGIEQFRKGDNLARTIDDVASEAASAAEMKAAATGNELIFTQVRLAAELKKLEGIYATFKRGQYQLDNRISYLEKTPAEAAKEIERWQKEIVHRDKHTTTEPFFAVGGKIYGKKNHKELAVEVARTIKKAVESKDRNDAGALSVGKYRGFEVLVEAHKMSCQFLLVGDMATYAPKNLVYEHGQQLSIQGFIERLDNYLARFEDNIALAEKTRDNKAQELIVARQSQGQEFPQMAMLEALRQDNRQVMAELTLVQKDREYKSTWKPQSEQLKAHEQEKALAHLLKLNDQVPGNKGASMEVAHIQVDNRGSFPIFNDRNFPINHRSKGASR